MFGSKNDALVASLREVYGAEDGDACFGALSELLEATSGQRPAKKNNKCEAGPRDYNVPCLIAYGDSLVPEDMSSHASPKKKRKTKQVSKTGTTPLQHLRQFLSSRTINVGGTERKPGEVFKLLHVLPFYPWDTDRGFSVKDYRKVDERNGTWDDLEDFVKDDIGLMFDFVANHASVENPLIQASLIQRHIQAGMPQYGEVQAYRDFVIAYAKGKQPSKENLLKLARPRPNPVLTPYYVVHDTETNLCKARLGAPEVDGLAEGREKVLGDGVVWTTFSRGKDAESGREETRQVDLNFSNFRVLVEVVKILLFYIEKGAELVRLVSTQAPSPLLPRIHLLTRALLFWLAFSVFRMPLVTFGKRLGAPLCMKRRPIFC